ncbi:MAG TPA: sugar kinase [Candidatus Poseidoniales archaeon]|nr:MAG TPA: sugar kinase [Candidatus Poseidoniales archaeon]HII24494.1 sugar kinase [Candidatus Poseidoniaceae archaeon]|tara:strand:+ start:759 stop:1727 length:969 start_codon:yes stop_codon:yes gene_type:complete
MIGESDDMDVLIVGSIAYDSITSPQGSAHNTLGGSATYAGLAASFHQRRLNLERIGLVGVVGTDFRNQDFATFSNAGLDTTGLEVVEGSTFHWVGSYHGNMAQAETHETHLNVFETFEPKVPEHGTTSTITFCANLHPSIQLSVLDQSTPARASILDSMNLWINIAHDELLQAMKRVDIVVINDGEAMMLAGTDNLVQAAKDVQSMASIPTLIVKKGEHGVLALHGNKLVALPAYPTSSVVDPTGCGDTFAGTLAACLAAGEGVIEMDELRNALIHATVSASFTLEGFGIEGLESMTEESYESRLFDYCSISGCQPSRRSPS